MAISGTMSMIQKEQTY